MAEFYLKALKYKYSKSPLIEHISRRVHDSNKNFLMAVVGGTGSGKSYASLKMGELLDPDFNIDKVSFSVRTFMESVQRGYPEGTFLMFEEAGVGVPKKEWYSTGNKMFNYVAQTFRIKRYISCFTLPCISFIDSDLRKLFHCIADTQGIDEVNKINYIKPLLVQNNPRYAKTYYKRLRFYTEEGTKTLDKVGLGLPKKSLIKEYEAKKLEFTENLNKNILQELAANDDSKDKLALTSKQEAIYKLAQEKTQVEIGNLLGISQTKVSEQIRAIRKKGFTVPKHIHAFKKFKEIPAIKALEDQAISQTPL